MSVLALERPTSVGELLDWSILAMVTRLPMTRIELAARLGVTERQVKDHVRAMPTEAHEWDGQVYAGPASTSV